MKPLSRAAPPTQSTQLTQLTIRTADDLTRLLDRTQHYRAIRLDAPGVPEPQRQRWQDDLAHHYSGCGCGIGNLFGLAGVAVAGAYLLYVGAFFNPAANLWLQGGVAFALVVAFAAAGRWVGLRRAHRRLRNAVQSLAAVLHAAQAPAAAQPAPS